MKDSKDDVYILTMALLNERPFDAMRWSKERLFSVALADGKITEEQYEAAKKYYGYIWDYCGD